MSLVMLVEDEAVLRSSMARSLRRLPDVDVVEAGRMDEARRLLHEHTPSLIISDLSLPDGCGIDLLSEIDMAQLNVPIIFVTAYLGTYNDQIPRRSNIEVFEKPLALEMLRNKVRSCIDKVPQKQSPFSLIDYLQLSGMGRHSVVLRLVQKQQQFGRIIVVEGRPWSAYAGGLIGFDAVWQLVFSKEHPVQAQPLIGAPGANNINASMEHLLLEVCRKQDETTIHREDPSTIPVGSTVNSTKEDELSAEDIDAAIQVLESGDWNLSEETQSTPTVPPVTRFPLASTTDLKPPLLLPSAVRLTPTQTKPARSALPPPGTSEEIRRYGDPVDSGESLPWNALFSHGSVDDWVDEPSLSPPTPDPARSMRDWDDGNEPPVTSKIKASSRSMRDWEDASDGPSTIERPQWVRQSWKEPVYEPEQHRSTPQLLARSIEDGENPQVDQTTTAKQRFDQLLDEGLSALLIREYELAWRIYSEASLLQPGNRLVLANLARIEALGFGSKP